MITRTQVAVFLLLSTMVTLSESKVFTRCELAKELHDKFRFPRRIIPAILCLARFGAEYNSSAVSSEFLDDSRSHGIFQINDYNWCSVEGDKPSECKLHCGKLHDDKLEDDVRCLRKILATRGFYEWDIWTKRCKGQYLMHYLQACVL